jgi:hypothetical protein
MGIVRFRLPDNWRDRPDIVLQVWIVQIQGFSPLYTGGEWLISKNPDIKVPALDRTLAIAWLEAWQKVMDGDNESKA